MSPEAGMNRQHTQEVPEMWKTLFSVALAATAVLIAGHAMAKKLPTGKGPCTQPSTCADGLCVEIDHESYCTSACGRCPPGMYCDQTLFQEIGLAVCLRGTGQARLEAPPRLPCARDDQCPGAMICAQKMGVRDCTIPCETDEQCAAPEVAGMRIDFMECAVDEAKRTRRACLPKESCIRAPMSCLGIDPTAMAASMHAGMQMAAATEQAAKATERREETHQVVEVFPPGMGPTPMAQPIAPGPTLVPGRELPPPAPLGPVPMDPPRFQALLGSLKKVAFWDERKAILQTAVAHNYFTCDQVSRVVGLLSFGDEKIAAIRLLADRIVDPENSFMIISKLTFDDEKAAARRILTR